MDTLAMMDQISYADIKTTQSYYLAGPADVQLRAVDAIDEGFLAPLLKRK